VNFNNFEFHTFTAHVYHNGKLSMLDDKWVFMEICIITPGSGCSEGVSSSPP
jgi:hypothetical protein